eukprot:Lithocolla_globosa_v1_NODE_2080_length_2177_cov_4.804901.p2 type:complete len:104 gc:universal NODE_2080_length_2177_cov_4.804901:1834-2145(+)
MRDSIPPIPQKVLFTASKTESPIFQITPPPCPCCCCHPCSLAIFAPVVAILAPVAAILAPVAVIPAPVAVIHSCCRCNGSGRLGHLRHECNGKGSKGEKAIAF